MTTGSLRLSPRFILMFAAALTVLLGTTQSQLKAAVPARGFDPVAFFTGATEGRGTLKKALSGTQATHVTGTGAMREGNLVIDQVVRIEGEKQQTRRWQLHEVNASAYSGTISDAKGPVSATIAGNELRIKYKMKDGGMSVSQVLTMAADGKSVRNTMKIKKFGIVFATMEETIRKL